MVNCYNISLFYCFYILSQWYLLGWRRTCQDMPCSWWLIVLCFSAVFFELRNLLALPTLKHLYLKSEQDCFSFKYRKTDPSPLSSFINVVTDWIKSMSYSQVTFPLHQVHREMSIHTISHFTSNVWGKLQWCYIKLFSWHWWMICIMSRINYEKNGYSLKCFVKANHRCLLSLSHQWLQSANAIMCFPFPRYDLSHDSFLINIGGVPDIKLHIVPLSIFKLHRFKCHSCRKIKRIQLPQQPRMTGITNDAFLKCTVTYQITITQSDLTCSPLCPGQTWSSP